MSASTQGSGAGVFDGINVTPLVDITLVLLIIFMVTARLIAGQGLPIDLPHAATSTEQQTVLSIALLESGDTLCNGRPVNPGTELGALARKARQDAPALRAVIQADGRVQHARVIQVMDILRQQNVTKIAFGVTPGAPSATAR